MQSLKGFSLIELIITLAVVAIMTSMALTFSGAFLQDNRMSTANNDLIGSINLARSVAISRGQRASICSSSNGSSCTGTAWELGWIVFTDSGVAASIDGNDKIIKVSDMAGIEISVSGSVNFIQFKPQGSTASICVDCYDNTNLPRIDTAFAAVFKNLSFISSAIASEGSSESSDNSGSSGGSGSSKANKVPTVRCVVPDSEVKAGDSGSSGGSGSSSGSSNSALNIFEQLSPISSAHASIDSEISDGTENSDDNENSDSSDGSSGSSSGSSGSSGATPPSRVNANFSVTCEEELPGTTTQNSPTSSTPSTTTATTSGSSSFLSDPSTFLVCDSSRAGESGNKIAVSAVGRVTREKFICN